MRLLKSPYFIILLISVLFLLIFSSGTSPLFFDNYETDSAIFIVIGKALVNGKSLYVDIFDHKGPILFFIEALGQLISSGRNGIFFLQVVFLYISLIFSYKTLILFCNKKTSLISILISIFILSYFICEGNLSEEFSLLFISLPLYLCFKWLKEKDPLENIPKINTFIYGICFSILAFIKISNAICLIGMILGITIILLRNRKIKELFKHMLIFILGMLVIVAPIFMYFYYKNSLPDMIYATFIHNFLYMGSEINFETNNIAIKLGNAFHLILGLMALFLYFKNEKNISIISIATILLAIIFYSLSYSSYHYYIATIPIFVITIGMFFNKIEEYKFDKYTRFLITFVIVFLCICYTTVHLIYNINTLFEREYLKKRIINQLVQEIEDKENILLYQTPASYYLYMDTIPEYKYAFLQEFIIRSNPEIKEKIMNDLKNGNIKYIILNNELRISPEIIQILENYFTEINQLETDYRIINNSNMLKVKSMLTLYKYNEASI